MTAYDYFVRADIETVREYLDLFYAGDELSDDEIYAAIVNYADIDGLRDILNAIEKGTWPKMTAYTEWCKRHPSGDDHPRVSVWYPRSIPSARLHTISLGNPPIDILPTGSVHAYVTIAGYEIGGTLDDLELLLKAATECLADVREYADALRGDES